MSLAGNAPPSSRARPKSGGRAHEDDGPWPPEWMLDLERAHDQLRHAARLLVGGARADWRLAPAAAALGHAMVRVYDAIDERHALLASTRAAMTNVDEARALLEPAATEDAAIGFALEYLRDARAHLTHAEDRVLPLVDRPRATAPDLRASVDVPVLHAVDRESLAPHLLVPDAPIPDVVDPELPPIEKPETFEQLERAIEELGQRASRRREAREKEREEQSARDAAARDAGEEAEDAPPPGFARELPRVLSASRFLHAKVRECFEEVSMIGVQRAPLLGDPWRSSLVLERRMLAALDAIVAMGAPALAALEALVLDSPVQDPSRTFGIAMVLGCVAGRDALAAAERVFYAFELADRDHAAQLAGAWKLAPHPLLPLALRTQLASSDPAHRALAIDVLGYRGMATLEELAAASRDAAPAVAAAALPYYALTGHHEVRGALDAAAESHNLPLRQAAWHAMSLSGHPMVNQTLRYAVSSDDAEEAAVPLAIVGDAKDAARLLELAEETRKRAFVNAVGWAGAATAVEPLMALLRVDDEDVRLAAAYALERITGAGLWEDTLLDPEDIMVPDVPDVDVGEPAPASLAELVSDPRDLPAKGALDTIKQPTTKLDRWTAWWAQHGERFDRRARYRRGIAYTPLVSWNELDCGPCTPGERRLLQRELIVRTGRFVRCDPHDLVVVQEQSLKAWEPFARQTSGTPGEWRTPMRGA